MSGTDLNTQQIKRINLAEAPRVVAVIQARVGSTRLRAKVLRDLGGMPVLEWVLRAARAAQGINEVVIATSDLPDDDVIEDFGRKHGVRVIRGSQDDVLSRFLLAAKTTNADAVVRLTADCPLLDPAVISQVVYLWRQDQMVDYVSTTQHRSLPRGLDVELVRSSALLKADERTEPHHRAHVTSAIYEEGAGFVTGSLSFQPSYNHFRVTLDTDEDAQLLDALVAKIGTDIPSWRGILHVLDENPDIVALNAHIEQKALEEG
ncbi:cytidylyltransferase domain-containing protein [Pseudarthrobacter sp. J1738]|uniref:cytidylyltransferase domain-containing protein n=1 Tax=unclassified Pseudarthrobacter TaxID=2647000 RepID=UPI003D2ABBC4